MLYLLCGPPSSDSFTGSCVPSFPTANDFQDDVIGWTTWPIIRATHMAAPSCWRVLPALIPTRSGRPSVLLEKHPRGCPGSSEASNTCVPSGGQHSVLQVTRPFAEGGGPGLCSSGFPILQSICVSSRAPVGQFLSIQSNQQSVTRYDGTSMMTTLQNALGQRTEGTLCWHKTGSLCYCPCRAEAIYLRSPFLEADIHQSTSPASRDSLASCSVHYSDMMAPCLRHGSGFARGQDLCR